MEASLNQQSSHGIMDELAAASSCSDASTGSSLSDFADDATSSSSWISPSSSDDRLGPLYEMSTLMAQLPFKRGLSKFFQGKSQSFTSLSNVRCLEDLAKPENPSKKKLKTCMSYGGDLNSHQRSNTQRASSFKPISKKAIRGSCSSLSAKRVTLFRSKPPTPPQRVGSLANQPPLFA